jgi:glycosyltransferase involved in cell wall biosynthesis
MRIALLAPPFIPVPPDAYGGTELFVAHLAEGLIERDHEVVVYANGESKVGCTLRWMFPKKDWPPRAGYDGGLKHLDHCVWALRDILDDRDKFDVVHINDAIAVPLSRFLPHPVVHTLHHPHEPELSALYARYPQISYVTISDAQRELEELPRISTIHHGIRVSDYEFREQKDGYLAFLGRIAPVKGPHLAIEVARKAGIPLKIAGEVQPVYDDYWKSMVKPHIDGRMVQFLGEAAQQAKNELLRGATALLFPIQWNEPFGLVMIEAMACGTPVLAFEGGAVSEIVVDGVSGWICGDIDEMAARAVDPGIPARFCRRHVERYFCIDRMVADYEALYRTCAGNVLVANRLDGATLGS